MNRAIPSPYSKPVRPTAVLPRRSANLLYRC